MMRGKGQGVTLEKQCKSREGRSMPEPSHPVGAVFISYCSQDAPAAERICEALRAVGIDVWLDKNELRGGDAWDAQIKKRIHDCALFIPVISANTNARKEGYFRREWKQATRRLQDMADDVAFLVPVVIDETREADARVPEEFLSAQWTWLKGGESPSSFAQRVRQLLGGDSASALHSQSATMERHEPSAREEHSARTWPRFDGRDKHRVRSIAFALSALLLVLGGGLYWYYKGSRDELAAKPASATATPVAAAAPSEKSIAVLPFADMSPNKDQEYMSDGIAEELLNLLTRVPDLKVIARTSSFAFKGQNTDIAEIARKLDVAHVLEGSVRKSDNKVRITAQLIRTSDSSHLWSKTYDRMLDDIFAVQGEIATAIVHALRVRLVGMTLSRQEGGTQSREAYELYLRGWYGEDLNSRESLDAAEAYLKDAIHLDPKYGLAWSALASINTLRAELGYLDAKEAFARARQLTQRALELAPECAHAHSELQSILFTYDWNFVAAEVESQRALALAPTDSNVLNGAGRLSITLGRFEDARRQLRAALVRDPLNEYVIYNLALTYYLERRFVDAEKIVRRLLEISPQFPWTRVLLGQTLLLQGRLDEALATVQEDGDEGMRLVALPIVLRAAGRHKEADIALQAQIEHWQDKSASFIALSYAHRGDYDLALRWLERAYEQRDPSLFEVIGDPLFGEMLDEPRYKAYRRKLNLPDLAKAA